MRPTKHRPLVITTLLAVNLLVPGCGGGGSGSGNQVFGGTLLDQNNNRLSGYQVVFDKNTQLATITDSRGQFRIFIPDTAVTGKDTFSVYDATGVLEDTEPLPTNFAAQRTFRVTLPSLGPPTAPAL